MAKQPIDQDKHDDGTETATTQFLGAITGDECTKKIIHFFYGRGVKNYATGGGIPDGFIQEEGPSSQSSTNRPRASLSSRSVELPNQQRGPRQSATEGGSIW
jgi:hypothetical protein